MDFTISPELEDLRLRVRRFIAEEVMPLETDRENYNEYDNIKLSVLAPMREKAKAAGLWAPQMPVERGGLGLSVSGWAVFYEEAARSIFFASNSLNAIWILNGNAHITLSLAAPLQWRQ